MLNRAFVNIYMDTLRNGTAGGGRGEERGGRRGKWGYILGGCVVSSTQ